MTNSMFTGKLLTLHFYLFSDNPDLVGCPLFTLAKSVNPTVIDEGNMNRAKI